MNNAKTGKILGISSIVVGLLSPLIGLVLGITTLIMARRYELYSLGNKSFKQEKMLGWVGPLVSVVMYLVNIYIVMLQKG